MEAGCSVPSPCDSSPCPANSVCKDEWQSYSCVCLPGRACRALGSPHCTSSPLPSGLPQPGCHCSPAPSLGNSRAQKSLPHMQWFLWRAKSLLSPSNPLLGTLSAPGGRVLSLRDALCPHLRVLWRGLRGCLSPQPLQEQVRVSPQAGLAPGLRVRVCRELFRAVLRAQVRCRAHSRAMASGAWLCAARPSQLCDTLLLGAAGRRPGRCGRCNSEDVSVPRMDQQCPKGWWGNPSCGPCNCDVNKGFDPDCNKTNGQCHCKVRGSCARGDVACLCLVLFSAWQLPGRCFASSPPCGPPGPAR